MPEVSDARLVALGIEPLDDRKGTVVLPRALDVGDAERLIAVLTAARRTGPVLIVGDADAPATTWRRVRMARTAAEHGRVGVLRTTLPPLAARVLVSQARTLLDDGYAGWVHTALGVLERRYTAFAVLGSITGLRRPVPRFRQHVASMVPGTDFVAVTHPVAQITRVRRGQPVAVPRPQGPSTALLAASDQGAERLAGIALELAGRDARPVTPGPDDQGWWGTSRLVEGVVHPDLTPELRAELHASIPLHTCAWCGGRVASRPCAFCAFGTVDDVAGRVAA